MPSVAVNPLVTFASCRLALRRTAKAVGATAGALTGVGASCLAYAGLYEVNAFRLRTIAVRVLPPGTNPIRALHISDIHMVPAARTRQRWLSGLADLKPDLVINTGDNLAHRDAVPYVVDQPGGSAEGAGGLRVGVE